MSNSAVQIKTFERFYILKYNQNKINSQKEDDPKDFDYIDELLLYPKIEKDDLKIKVKPFVFVGIENNIQESLSSKEIFYFVLTLADGERMFVFCLRNYQVNVVEPLTFLFITKSGYFNLFKEILKQIEKIYNVSMDYLDPFLQILQKASLPQKGKTLEISLSPQLKLSNKQFQFHRQDVPLCDYPLIELFSRFNGRDILRIFAALILERRIIFISSNLTILTSSIYSSLSLIQPFKWSVVLIPIVPKQLTDACYAPIPYVLGIHKMFEESIKEYDLEEITIIDLDKKEIESDPVDLVLLPSLQATKLMKNLNKHLNEWNETKQFPREKIVSEFKNSIKDIFKGIENNFVPNTENKEELEFNYETFHSKKSRRVKKFLSAFEQTQMFENYLQEIKEKVIKESIQKETDLSLSVESFKSQQQNQKNSKIQTIQMSPKKLISKLSQNNIKSKFKNKNKNKSEKDNNTKNKNNNNTKDNNNNNIKNDNSNNKFNNYFKNFMSNNKKKDSIIYPSMKHMIDEISQIMHKSQNLTKRNSRKNLDLEDLNKDLEIINLENENENENENNPDREMLNVISDMVSKQNPKRLSDKFFFSPNNVNSSESNHKFFGIRGRARIEMMKNLNILKKFQQKEKRKKKKKEQYVQIRGKNTPRKSRKKYKLRRRSLSLKLVKTQSKLDNNNPNEKIININATNSFYKFNSKENHHSNKIATINKSPKYSSSKNLTRPNPLIQGRKFGQPIRKKNHQESNFSPISNTKINLDTENENRNHQSSLNSQIKDRKRSNIYSKDSLSITSINTDTNNNLQTHYNSKTPPIPPRNVHRTKQKSFFKMNPNKLFTINHKKKKNQQNHNTKTKGKKLFRSQTKVIPNYKNNKYQNYNLYQDNNDDHFNRGKKINKKPNSIDETNNSTIHQQNQNNQNQNYINKRPPNFPQNDHKNSNSNSNSDLTWKKKQNNNFQNSNNNKEFNMNSQNLKTNNYPNLNENKNKISFYQRLNNNNQEKKQNFFPTPQMSNGRLSPPIPPRKNPNKNTNTNTLNTHNYNSNRIKKINKKANSIDETNNSNIHQQNENNQNQIYKNKRLPNFPKNSNSNSNSNSNVTWKKKQNNNFQNNNKEINTNSVTLKTNTNSDFQDLKKDLNSYSRKTNKKRSKKLYRTNTISTRRGMYHNPKKININIKNSNFGNNTKPKKKKKTIRPLPKTPNSRFNNQGNKPTEKRVHQFANKKTLSVSYSTNSIFSPNHTTTPKFATLKTKPNFRTKKN
ncbi:suppression of tumorigenicity 5 st5 [Anaeramoeba flamelloides]|uniref:Suppression of tumorigenicity 5 st5 n=1 Tax=Anaeramoeba flamelloides TaxID=1746091 RepID=A0AAV7ZH44_9EUKA|nr:suppression of tumorigenicity 5 st5 [Anaeramoeba flamelloides]